MCLVRAPVKGSSSNSLSSVESQSKPIDSGI
jgi:hypothetical protein